MTEQSSSVVPTNKYLVYHRVNGKKLGTGSIISEYNTKQLLLHHCVDVNKLDTLDYYYTLETDLLHITKIPIYKK